MLNIEYIKKYLKYSVQDLLYHIVVIFCIRLDKIDFIIAIVERGGTRLFLLLILHLHFILNSFDKVYNVTIFLAISRIRE